MKIFQSIKKSPSKKECKSLESNSSKIPHFYMRNACEPIWSGRNYEQFCKTGYIRNAVAARAINMIATAAASVEILMYRKVGDKRINLTTHPLLDLLNKPNPIISGKDFLESIYTYKIISGNCYIQGIRLSTEQMPKELYLLRPDRVTILAGDSCLPLGYQYQVGQYKQDFYIDQATGFCDVLHIKNFHPLDDWYGLSNIESVAFAIDQHNECATWNKSLLQNSARPSGALMVNATSGNSSGTLTDEQYIRIKEQLEDTFSGGINSGRPILLEGGLDWKEMSLSPKDMDFIESKNSAARDIALGLGIPPQLLGLPGDNTYNNMSEARLSLWEQTVIPMIQDVCSALSYWFSLYLDESLELSFDADSISTLIERRQTMWQNIENVNFLTINEKREMFGFNKIAGGDTIVSS